MYTANFQLRGCNIWSDVLGSLRVGSCWRHVQEERRNVYNSVFWKCERKRQFGRLKHRRESNIKLIAEVTAWRCGMWYVLLRVAFTCGIKWRCGKGFGHPCHKSWGFSTSSSKYRLIKRPCTVPCSHERTNSTFYALNQVQLRHHSCSFHKLSDCITRPSHRSKALESIARSLSRCASFLC